MIASEALLNLRSLTATPPNALETHITRADMHAERQYSGVLAPIAGNARNLKRCTTSLYEQHCALVLDIRYIISKIYVH